MGIIQYKVGKEFENRVLEYYKDKGYYAYKFPTDFNGTICDIIVSKKGSCMFIECKHTNNDKLYYKGCGIEKKRDEIDNFINKTHNNLFIFISSKTKGYFWTTWLKAKPIFEKKGYLDLEGDCYKANV
jgi:Holliday junction resolvase